MHPFRYHRPSELPEALEIYREADDARWLAGGMTLLPAMKLRLAAPTDLVDIAALKELRGLVADDRQLAIGAMTCHADVAACVDVRRRLSALSVLADGIGDAQVRNRGTIGGSIANNDPSADYPAAVLGLDAIVVTNEREIAADQFFTGLFETALREHEVVRQIRFPLPDLAGYVKFAHPASRYAVVGAMVSKKGKDVRVAITGAAACVFRVPEMEQALADDFSPAALERIRVERDDFNEDMHAGPEYRAHLVNVMARRAVAAAQGPG